MLSPRTETILRAIVGQYITRAVPVPSHSLTNDAGLDVSPATIRNEMVHLEQEGYIRRPHTSAGGIPLDKGYRRYVASLGDVEFPIAEQRLVSHLFHQVELELEAWLELAATLTSQKTQNVALVSTPRPEACQFKRLEVVSLKEMLALVVLVLRGATVRQQLVTFEQPVSQEELTAMTNKLNELYSGVTDSQIQSKSAGLSVAEQRVTDCVVKLMEAEDRRENEDSYLDGLHFTLGQPEFANNRQLAQALMELVEQRTLLKNILSAQPGGKGVQVIIGKENSSDALRDYSVVIGRYGLPDEAEGTICVVGPTRMPYGRTIATVDYLSRVLSGLVAKLYGGETLPARATDSDNRESKK